MKSYYYVSSKLYRELEKAGKINMKRCIIVPYLKTLYCDMCEAETRDACICDNRQ